MRLDLYLSQKYPGYSRSVLQKLIKSGKVKVNGEIVNTPKKLVSAEATVRLDPPQKNDFTDQTLPTIYEDDNVVVVDKPTGILTHSKGALNDEFTVADFVRSRVSEPKLQTSTLQDSNRFGIVHRLDRGTSGVIIGAKNDGTHKMLQKQFQNRQTKKTYLAILDGIPKEPEAIIDVPIGRNPKKPAEFRPDVNGKSAITRYKVLATNQQGQALVELKPETGRTHQLRVHMQFIGTPIQGDVVYGSGKAAERMFLHAKALEITIPGRPTNQRKTFTAPVPPEFTKEFPDA